MKWLQIFRIFFKQIFYLFSRAVRASLPFSSSFSLFDSDTFDPSSPADSWCTRLLPRSITNQNQRLHSAKVVTPNAKSWEFVKSTMLEFIGSYSNWPNQMSRETRWFQLGTSGCSLSPLAWPGISWVGQKKTQACNIPFQIPEKS